jgi:hypothetical protein
MRHSLKLNEIIYKRLIKGPASVELGSDRKCLRITLEMFFVSNIVPIRGSNPEEPNSVWTVSAIAPQVK